MMTRNFRSESRGFTVIEMLVALAVIGILAMIALPAYQRMQAAAKYREESRGIASSLRDARSRAVSQNLEHRVVFNVSAAEYRIEQGNQSSGSTTWTPVFAAWEDFQPGILMRSTSACNSTANVTIQFNPNGTGDSGYLCIMDSDGNQRFKVGVADSATGRVVIE